MIQPVYCPLSGLEKVVQIKTIHNQVFFDLTECLLIRHKPFPVFAVIKGIPQCCPVVRVSGLVLPHISVVQQQDDTSVHATDTTAAVATIIAKGVAALQIANDIAV